MRQNEEAHSTESSKSLLEILTLVTSGNIRGSDNVFTLRSFTYIMKHIGHAVDSYLSVLNLKQSILVAFTPLIYTFLSTDISSRPDFILFLLEINTSGFTSAPKTHYFFLPFFQFALL
jgi:hypothetical protein